MAVVRQAMNSLQSGHCNGFTVRPEASAARCASMSIRKRVNAYDANAGSSGNDKRRGVP
jgi:hypothetical protein